MPKQSSKPLSNAPLIGGYSEYFPEDLSGLTVIESSSEEFGSILKDQQGNKFTLERANDSYKVRDKIVVDRLCQSLGVEVSNFAVYTQLPTELARRCGYQETGIYRLAEYLGADSDSKKSTMTVEQIAKLFVVHAWLGMLDQRHAHMQEVDTLLGKHEHNDLITRQIEELLSKWSDIESELWLLHKTLNLEEAEAEQRITLYHENLQSLVDRFCPNLLPLAMTHAKAKEGVTSAGVLVYTFINNEPYVLLAERMQDEGWGNLGGLSEASDGRLVVTASRETREESMGLIDYSSIELANMPSHDLIIHNDTIGGYRLYRMYIATLPYFSPEKLNQELRSSSTPYRPEHYQFHWFKLQDLYQQAIHQRGLRFQATTDKGQTVDLHLHPPFCEMLEQKMVQTYLKEILEKKRPIVRKEHTRSAVKTFNTTQY